MGFQQRATPQPTIGSLDAVASPAGVSATWAVGTVVATGTATASPSGVSATWAVGTPTATGAALTSPSGVLALWDVGTAIATGGSAADATASPAGVAALWAVGDAVAAGEGRIAGGGTSVNYQAHWPKTGTAKPKGVSAQLRVGTVHAVGTVGALRFHTDAFADAFAPLGLRLGHAVARPGGVAARVAPGPAQVSVSAVARARSAPARRRDADDELALLLLLLQDDEAA